MRLWMLREVVTAAKVFSYGKKYSKCTKCNILNDSMQLHADKESDLSRGSKVEDEHSYNPLSSKAFVT